LKRRVLLLDGFGCGLADIMINDDGGIDVGRNLLGYRDGRRTTTVCPKRVTSRSSGLLISLLNQMIVINAFLCSSLSHDARLHGCGPQKHRRGNLIQMNQWFMNSA
jgi:hypothetical protein